jgi:hypothetical protein
MGTLRTVLLVGATIAILASSPRAAASPRAATRLSYVRDLSAATCPDESVLRQEIAQRLGYDPIAPAARDRVSAVLTSADERFRAVVQYEDEAGRVRGARELDANDCGELVSSIALTVVILLDPPGAHAAPPLAPEPADVPVVPVVAPPPPPSDRAPPRDAQGRARLRTGAGSLGSVGVAPAPALGFYAFAGAQLERWSVDAEGRADLPASSTDARTSLVLGTVAPCLREGLLLFCATASFGVLHGEGLGAGEPRRASTFYSAVGPRMAVELPVAPFLRFHARVDGAVPLTPTTLRQAGAEIWTTPTVGGSVGLGVTGLFL